MQMQGNGGNNDWRGTFKLLLGINDLDEFVEEMVKDEATAMLRVYDHINKKEYYDKASESVCKGSTH